MLMLMMLCSDDLGGCNVRSHHCSLRRSLVLINMLLLGTGKSPARTAGRQGSRSGGRAGLLKRKGCRALVPRGCRIPRWRCTAAGCRRSSGGCSRRWLLRHTSGAGLQHVSARINSLPGKGGAEKTTSRRTDRTRRDKWLVGRFLSLQKSEGGRPRNF